jgi:hypothetical protein
MWLQPTRKYMGFLKGQYHGETGQETKRVIISS